VRRCIGIMPKRGCGNVHEWLGKVYVAMTFASLLMFYGVGKGLTRVSGRCVLGLLITIMLGYA
jgi:hypothetical protein